MYVCMDGGMNKLDDIQLLVGVLSSWGACVTGAGWLAGDPRTRRMARVRIASHLIFLAHHALYVLRRSSHLISYHLIFLLRHTSRMILKKTSHASALPPSHTDIIKAIDRVHRLGQRRDVRVFRFTIKDTVEQQMLVIQARCWEWNTMYGCCRSIGPRLVLAWLIIRSRCDP